MNINWLIRFKNPSFWVSVVIAVVTPVFAYFGLTAQDLTTWASIGDLIYDAVSNPYVVLTMLVGLYNAVVDPTSTGVTDSAKVLTYTEPNSVKR